MSVDVRIVCERARAASCRVNHPLTVSRTSMPRVSRLADLLRSRTAQGVTVAACALLVAGFHWENDGLWFQGDAPRHAINGLFWWDLLAAHPLDPLDYAIRYYARYPVIAPATYPPLFYVLEGAAFSLFAATPYVARVVVLLFTCMAGLYAMAWARRWLGAIFGWAGVLLVCLPGVVVWSTAVMLNVPSMALCLASLYHFRRALEDHSRAQIVLTTVALMATVLTYYQSASIVAVCAVWAILWGKSYRPKARWVYAVAIGAAVIPLALAMTLAPVQLMRHLPSLQTLGRISTATFYWRALPDLVGPVVLALAGVALLVALWTKRTRTESLYLGTWCAVLIVTFSLLPAKDRRYLLLAVPPLALACALGLAALAERLRNPAPRWQALGIASAITVSLWSAAQVQVPVVSGFREMAVYLKRHAPADAVLYDGPHDGVFGFYVRALDPQFERRIVRADKLLYAYGPTTTFRPVEQSNVSSSTEVEHLIRYTAGARWVAVEIGPDAERLAAQRLLRQSLVRPAFEHVRSFPVRAGRIGRVELYRLVGPVAAAPSIDLVFPAVTTRVFQQVVPVTR
jgi:hypothetical protein